jgi:hypothetical protein
MMAFPFLPFDPVMRARDFPQPGQVRSFFRKLLTM